MNAADRSCETTHIAIVQKPPVILDLQASLERAVSYIADSAKEGAELVVFPETWLTCYPAWVFGLAGWGDETARYWHGRLVQESPSLKELRALRQAAAEHRITVVMGVNERRGRTLYNSVITVGSRGDLVNVHRKLMPTHTERTVWGMGTAEGLSAVDTPAGRIGSLICWEHWMPLARQALHNSSEDIHVSLWPDMPEMHQVAARSYAFEGRCFVVSAGLYTHTADVPEELLEAYRYGVAPDAPEEGVLFHGGSSIIDPFGNWIVEPVYGKETILMGTIDRGLLSGAHLDLDVAGHYSRRDIFDLHVNRRRIDEGAS